MLQKIKNWLNRDKIEFERRFKILDDRLQNTSFELDQYRAGLKQANEELSVFRAKEAKDKEKYDSTEPWIEIKSDGIDPIKGMVIECDWNSAFIQFLKENGITAKDESAAVQRYIACLYEDLIRKMEEQIIDNSDKPGRVSDFT